MSLTIKNYYKDPDPNISDHIIKFNDKTYRKNYIKNPGISLHIPLKGGKYEIPLELINELEIGTPIGFKDSNLKIVGEQVETCGNTSMNVMVTSQNKELKIQPLGPSINAETLYKTAIMQEDVANYLLNKKYILGYKPDVIDQNENLKNLLFNLEYLLQYKIYEDFKEEQDLLIFLQVTSLRMIKINDSIKGKSKQKAIECFYRELGDIPRYIIKLLLTRIVHCGRSTYYLYMELYKRKHYKHFHLYPDELRNKILLRNISFLISKVQFKTLTHLEKLCMDAKYIIIYPIYCLGRIVKQRRRSVSAFDDKDTIIRLYRLFFFGMLTPGDPGLREHWLINNKFCDDYMLRENGSKIHKEKLTLEYLLKCMKVVYGKTIEITQTVKKKGKKKKKKRRVKVIKTPMKLAYGPEDKRKKLEMILNIPFTVNDKVRNLCKVKTHEKTISLESRKILKEFESFRDKRTDQKILNDLIKNLRSSSAYFEHTMKKLTKRYWKLVNSLKNLISRFYGKRLLLELLDNRLTLYSTTQDLFSDIFQKVTIGLKTTNWYTSIIKNDVFILLCYAVTYIMIP